MPEDGISAVKYNGTALLSQQGRIGRAQLGPCMWVKLCVVGGSARMHAHERMSAYWGGGAQPWAQLSPCVFGRRCACLAIPG